MSRNRLGLSLVLAALGFACHSSSSSGGGLKTLTGPQTGTVTVNLTSGKVTVTNPQALKVTAAATYDDPTDQVTLSLVVRNNSKSILHNPKVLVTGLSEGTVTGDGSFGPAPIDGVASSPYFYLGPNSMGSKDEAMADVVIDGVTGAANDFSLDLEVVFHPWLIVPSGFDDITGEDSSGTGEGFALDASGLSYKGDNGPNFQPTAVSADTGVIYMGSRNQPAVAMLDLTTMSVTYGDSLVGGTIAFDQTGAVGFIDGPEMSPDGNYLYAVSNHTHVYDNTTYVPGAVTLHKLNASTLAEVDSLVVYEPVVPPVDGGSSPQYRGRAISMNSDGTLGAIPLLRLGLVAYVNLETMELIDTDDVTEGTQLFDVNGTSAEPRMVAMAPDGSAIYVAYSYDSGIDGTLDVIDTATGTITTSAPPTLETFAGPGMLKFGPDGRLYYGRVYLSGTGAGLSIYDPGTDTWIEIPDSDYCYSLAFSADGSTYYVNDYDEGQFRMYDIATDALLTFEASGLDELENTATGIGHGFVITD